MLVHSFTVIVSVTPIQQYNSVLGPVLFILYTTPFTCLIEKNSIRHEMFADDTQLNHPESPDNYSALVRSLQDCVKDIGLWMKENKLQLNNGKTEAIRFSSPSLSLIHI